MHKRQTDQVLANLRGLYCPFRTMDVVYLGETLNKEIVLPKLEIDLGKLALYELQFLHYIDERRSLYYNEEFVNYSIIRYEKYWMPFLAKMSEKMTTDLEFAPPLDIHWVWHVHMLAPVQYNKDCTAISKRILGHQLESLDKLVEKRRSTKSKWQETYPEIPFEVDLTHLQSHPEQLEAPSSIEYDIKAAALR